MQELAFITPKRFVNGPFITPKGFVNGPFITPKGFVNVILSDSPFLKYA